MAKNLKKGDTYRVPIDKCLPNEWNPNELDDDTFNRLAREIEENGMLNPIHLVPLDDGNYRIIGGEHRWKVCQVLGHTDIEAKLLTDKRFRSEDLQKFITVRQNVIKGELNPKKFASLYEDLVKTYSDEALQELLAFTDNDKWVELTGHVQKALSDTGMPEEFMEEFKDKTKKTKNVDDLGMILDSLFEKHGHDLKYSFLVFTFAGQDHYYIKMDKAMYSRMNKMAAFCRNNAIDINKVFGRLLEIFSDRSSSDSFIEQCKLTDSDD